MAGAFMKPNSIQQGMVAAVLVALVVLTQGQHAFATMHWPPAAWAALFLGGYFLRQWFYFALAAVGIAFIDYAAIAWGGVSGICITTAYLFIFLAYGLLWAAGRYLSVKDGLVRYTLVASGAIVSAEFISSGSYYVATHDWAGVGAMVNYLLAFAPQTLWAFAFWMVPAVLLQAVVSRISQPLNQRAGR
jgi:hypothetical protein